MYYVFRGDQVSEWSECKPLGPFTTLKACREAIRQDIEDYLGYADMLQAGRLTDHCELYSIAHVVASYRPALDVNVSVTLPKKQMHHQPASES